MSMTAETPPLDTRVLQGTAADLSRGYEGIFSPETVERYVFESYATLSRTAKNRIFLAVLAERFATDRLRALAIAQGKIGTTVPQVLFVCVHNVGRSQIATGQVIGCIGYAKLVAFTAVHTRTALIFGLGAIGIWLLATSQVLLSSSA
jgi:hypothetical protein